METKELTTLEEVKIYSDPYRLKILNVLGRMGRAATVKEVADKIGDVPAKVHYHMKKLERIGLVKMVSTKEINGIIAKYYEPFAGSIKINHEKNESEPIVKELMRSETHKLLAELFDQNRDFFFKQMSLQHKTESMLTTTSLFMTDDEANDLYKKVDELLKPYKKMRENEDCHKYEFFATNVRHYDENL
ncbi:hypothetical protein JCM10914A_53530 [Paenibacillus sp. JCM 10914]|uniref:ArsR/SmtB family transcription factor n=1 Tax=Paenibacillus sp. JCM 10914 TaxID=1236974 RepID=UPI0003CCA915|nr:helix-turn-helix domain-containing protein [Paenibacillus sp. JCM 10914]GAE04920.1 transcriptional regulator, ArsR family [Paenibacillus sp. JCM 10914]